jgi:hypothetical protein
MVRLSINFSSLESQEDEIAHEQHQKHCMLTSALHRFCPLHLFHYHLMPGFSFDHGNEALVSSTLREWYVRYIAT